MCLGVGEVEDGGSEDGRRSRGVVQREVAATEEEAFSIRTGQGLRRPRKSRAFCSSLSTTSTNGVDRSRTCEQASARRPTCMTVSP